MFKFTSQITKLKDKAATTEYTIQVTTDNYEQYKFIQDMARECVDGKHTEAARSMSDWIRAYPAEIANPATLDSDWARSCSSLEYVPPACIKCPNHPSNGGPGNCNCTLGGPTLTCSNINLTASNTMGEVVLINGESENSYESSK